MHTSQIHGLIQFLVSSTGFEHHQVDRLYMQLFVVCFSCIYVSSLAKLAYMHNYIPWTTACTKSLPAGEHMMFETCRRHQDLN
jgi:hypothetical protein